MSCFWDYIDTDRVAPELEMRETEGGEAAKFSRVWNVLVIAEHHGPPTAAAIGSPGDIQSRVEFLQNRTTLRK